MKAVGVIPSRYGSTRFPGKPLADISGKTLIERVYLQAKNSHKLNEVYVATDDKRIADKVKRFGGQAILTSEKHQSGTDRIVEAVQNIECDLVVNVQGDEPLIPSALIDQLVGLFEDEPELDAATAAHIINNPDEMNSPHAVKVVVDQDFYALRFSRSLIPAFLDKKSSTIHGWPVYFKHIGIYALTKKTLMDFSQWEPTPTEKVEKLEQLRLIENGVKMKVVISDYSPIAVDTPEDIGRVVNHLKKVDL